MRIIAVVIEALKEALFGKVRREPAATTLAELIGVTDIQNGVITRSDGAYALLFELQPINFRLRSDQEQEDIILSYAGILKMLKIPFKITTIARRADLSAHIDYMNNLLLAEADPIIKEQIEAYLHFIRELALNKAVTRRFIVSLFYHPPDGISVTFEQAAGYLYEQRGRIKEEFAKLGCSILEGDADYLAAETLYNLLNRGSSEIQELPHFEGQQGRTYLPMIFPSGLDATDPSCLVIDDCWTSTLLCVNFPFHVQAGWLDPLVSAGEGVEISLYHEPLQRGEQIRKITQAIGSATTTLIHAPNTVNTALQQNTLAHAQEIRQALSEGNDLWNMYLQVRVSASSKEELDSRMKSVMAILAANSIAYQKTHFRQLEAWISTLPHTDPHPLLAEALGRNILDRDLASTFPVISYELADPTGVFVGLNEYNGSPVLLDIFDTSKYRNANAILLGSSGSGKTFTQQLYAWRMRLQGVPVIMICPLKGFEYKALCDNLGGQYIRIAPGAKHCINMFDILPGDLREGESMLLQKVQSLRIFFSLLCPEISTMEKQILDGELIAMYGNYGITTNNESIYEPSSQGVFTRRRKLKQMPTFSDLYEQIRENPHLQDVAVQIVPYVSGSMSFLNGQTNVNPENDYVVYDISDMPNEGIAFAMLLALTMVWDRIKRNRNEKKLLVLDETWRLLGNHETAEFVFEIFKTIRGYMGAAMAATQEVGDFFSLEGGKYGDAIINSSAVKIILGLEDREARTLASYLDLSSEELRAIRTFQRGHGLLYAGQNHVRIDFRASRDEHSIITTPQRGRGRTPS